jgi:hypothetical protein
MSDKTTQQNSQAKLKGTDIVSKTETLLRKLIHVMGQENLALQAHDRSLAEEMAQEKTVLISNYRALIKDIEKDPEALKNLDEDTKSHVQKMISDFEVAMRENAKAVYARRYAVKKILERILDKARQVSGGNHKSYNQQGKMNDCSSSAKFIPTQLNETY